MFVALLWAARSRISSIFNFNMHKQILILIAAAMTSAAINAMANPSPTAQKYTCVMHPEVVMDHPGNCPKCGMKLVPLKQNKRRISNSDKSRAGAQRPTSNSEHMMHHGDDMAMPHRDHGGHEMHMEMHSTVDLADPMNREGSGTSWLPDSSPMYGRMFMFEDNMLMLHGAIFPRYTNVSTRRGDDRIDAPNWIMGMYSHPLGDTAQFGA